MEKKKVIAIQACLLILTVAISIYLIITPWIYLQPVETIALLKGVILLICVVSFLWISCFNTKSYYTIIGWFITLAIIVYVHVSSIPDNVIVIIPDLFKNILLVLYGTAIVVIAIDTIDFIRKKPSS